MNLYGYVGGDPVNYSDPFGLCLTPGSFVQCVKAAEAISKAGGTIVAAMGPAVSDFVHRSVSGAEVGVRAILGSSTIWRSGAANPGNLTARAGEGAVSMRNSLSNPVGSAGRPVFKPGAKATEIDVSRLPKGSAVLDNNPDGHVSVTATPDQIKAAVVRTITLPQ